MNLIMTLLQRYTEYSHSFIWVIILFLWETQIAFHEMEANISHKHHSHYCIFCSWILFRFRLQNVGFKYVLVFISNSVCFGKNKSPSTRTYKVSWAPISHLVDRPETKRMRCKGVKFLSELLNLVWHCIKWIFKC